MALTISTTITLAAGEQYTELEARIVAAMQAHPAGSGLAPAAETAAAPAAEEPKKAPARKAKATPAPESAASTTPAVLDTTLDEPAAAEPEDAAEEADEDLLGGTTKEYTLEDAVTLATNLVSEGKAAAVKAALAAAGGAKKVSELKGDAIATFIQALEA